MLIHSFENMIWKWHFDSCFMGENLVIETYLAGKGRLGNVVHIGTNMRLAKIRKLYKWREMDIREQLAFSATKGSCRSCLSK